MRLLLLLTITLCTVCAMDTHAQSWARHSIDASSQGADGARLGDFNGDGLMDIVTPWEEGGTIRIAFNPGADKVKEVWPSIAIGAVGQPEDAMAMDVDGDGRLDVVSSCEGKQRSIFVHWAPKKAEDLMNPEKWETEVLPASNDRMQFMFSAAMDVNQDGRMDLISGGKNNDAVLGWFEAPEKRRNLKAWDWHPIMPLGWLMSLHVVTGESEDDTSLLISDRRGTYRGVYRLETKVKGKMLRKLLNKDKDKEKNPWAIKYVGGNKQEVMFMDYIRRGDDDWTIAWAVSDGEVVKIRTDFSKKSVVRIPMPETSGLGKAVALGDLDNDGLDEIVVSCEHSEGKNGVFYFTEIPSAVEGIPSGWAFRDIAGLEGTKFDRIELIDLDNDGDLDVVTCEERENLGVIWYENPTK